MIFLLKKKSRSKIAGLSWAMFFLASVLFFPPTIMAADNFRVTVPVTCPDGKCSLDVLGCIDSKASNYNPLATKDDGSCQYTPPPDVVVRGCTDPTARNYNSNATLDDGSCTYNVTNVSGFSATYDENTKKVRLIWNNPNFRFFSGVRIVKSATSVPTDPNDGEIIYDGSGRSVLDGDVTPDSRYYYAAFAYNSKGDYSSGVITDIKIPKIEEPVVEPPITPPDDGGGDNGGVGDSRGHGGISGGFVPFPTSSPFASLPVVDEKATSPVNLDNVGFTFTQTGEFKKYLYAGGSISVKGNKNITIFIPYENLPQVLKTVGVTIYYPDDNRLSLSFILRINGNKTAYEATIGPLPEGRYPVAIYFIDYQNQALKMVRGTMAVSNAGFLTNTQVDTIINNVLAPTAAGAGVALGAAQLVMTSANVASFTDLYLLLVRGFGALLGYLGLKKKQKPWGTVYDAVTKRPIDPAYVTIEARGEEVSSSITDIDGRYGFFLAPGEYLIKAGKTHYKFPSDILKGREADELYGGLYFGEKIKVDENEVINKNIPLDPVGFDWNEFAKTKTDFFKVYSQKELRRSYFVKVVYSVGFLVTTAYLIFAPSILNLVVFSFYLAVYLFGYFWDLSHKVISLTKGPNHEPLPFAIIRVFMAEVDQQIKSVVADKMGKFFILVRPGKYYLTVEEKTPDGTYNKIYQSEPMELKKGILEKNIAI